MSIIPISSLHHPGVEMFTSLTEAQLRNRIDPSQGIFIAESPKVIHVALEAGHTPIALLCEERHITGDAASIIARCGDLPVYTGERELLASLTGYTLTRGVLCAMRRPTPPRLDDVLRNARRVVVIDGVVDTTNIGAIFRSAAALGVDADLLRSSQSALYPRLYGFYVSRPLDMDNPAAHPTARLWFHHGRHGTH